MKVSETVSTGSSSLSKDLLSEVFVLLEPKKKTGKKKKGLNQQAVCITDVDVLNDLKAQEEEKAKIERQKLDNAGRKKG